MSSDDEEEQPQILRITQRTAITPYIEQIWADMSRNYYVAFEWDPQFYALLAYQGFVSVAQERFLLPEMQKKYGVLLLDKLHVEKAVRRRSRFYRFVMDRHFDEVIRRINLHHRNSWVVEKYQVLLKQMFATGPIALKVGQQTTVFQIHTPELIDEDGTLVAGELGYRIGNTYTSLTGFFDTTAKTADGKLKHSSCGKIQMIALGMLMRENGFDLWNLGHPPQPEKDLMVYKSDIGADVVSRKDFLSLWIPARSRETAKPLTTPPSGISARELIEANKPKKLVENNRVQKSAKDLQGTAPTPVAE